MFHIVVNSQWIHLDAGVSTDGRIDQQAQFNGIVYAIGVV